MGNLSGRQRVDTWGQCPAKNLKAFSCSISLRAGEQSVSRTASIPFIIHMLGTVRCSTRIVIVMHCPLCVYPLSTWHHHNQISQVFSLRICISKTGGGNSLGVRLQVTRNSSNSSFFLYSPVWFNWIKVFYNSQYYNQPVILLTAKTKTTDIGLCVW